MAAKPPTPYHTTMKAFLGRWVPPILWMGAIFLFSTERFSYQETSRFLLPLLGWLFPLISLEGQAFVHAALRKIGHPLEYMILSYLWARALKTPSLLLPPPSFPAFLFSAFYAMLDEGHQTFVPTRTGSFWDVLLDALGAAFTQGLLWLRSVRGKKKEG